MRRQKRIRVGGGIGFVLFSKRMKMIKTNWVGAEDGVKKKNKDCARTKTFTLNRT